MKKFSSNTMDMAYAITLFVSIVALVAGSITALVTALKVMSFDELVTSSEFGQWVRIVTDGGVMGMVALVLYVVAVVGFVSSSVIHTMNK